MPGKNFAFLLCALLCIFIMPAYAQEATPEADSTCPAIVQTAISLTSLRCETTGANQVCYGHLVLDAQPRTEPSLFEFSEPGDIVDVIAVQSLRLSAMDTITGQWGVVLMQIEAALAESQNEASVDRDVQILLFGDATLTDANQFLTATAPSGQAVNIRNRPSAASTVIASLPANESITVNGWLEDSADIWLRVRLPSESAAGWLRADVVNLNGELETLPLLTLAEADEPSPDNTARYGPMQAFYFQSGINDAPCPEAPNSGVLIQTPEGVASVTIWLDEVVIQMSGTAYVNAQPDSDLTINVLEGNAQVEAQGETRAVFAGMQVTVPIDENLTASAIPSDPQPYTEAEVQSLPLSLLDDPITITPPLTIPAGTPLVGNWRFTWDADALTCTDGKVVPFLSTGEVSLLSLSAEGLSWGGIGYIRSTTGIYRASYRDGGGNLHQDTLQVIASDRIEGEKVLDLVTPVCTLNVSFRLQLVSPEE